MGTVVAKYDSHQICCVDQSPSGKLNPTTAPSAPSLPSGDSFRLVYAVKSFFQGNLPFFYEVTAQKEDNYDFVRF